MLYLNDSCCCDIWIFLVHWLIESTKHCRGRAKTELHSDCQVHFLPGPPRPVAHFSHFSLLDSRRIKRAISKRGGGVGGVTRTWNSANSNAGNAICNLMARTWCKRATLKQCVHSWFHFRSTDGKKFEWWTKTRLDKKCYYGSGWKVRANFFFQLRNYRPAILSQEI